MQYESYTFKVNLDNQTLGLSQTFSSWSNKSENVSFIYGGQVQSTQRIYSLNKQLNHIVLALDRTRPHIIQSINCGSKTQALKAKKPLVQLKLLNVCT